jgi:hypothetical protein
MPAEAKYFCVSDSTAKYLQKYITIRKRKLFVGERSTTDLIPLIKKHTTENYLLPGGDTQTMILSAGGRWVGRRIAIDYALVRPFTFNSEASSYIGIPWLSITAPFGGKN